MVHSGQELVERLHRETGKQIDMMRLARCVTFDVIGSAGFGVDFNSVSGSTPKEFTAFEFVLGEYMRRIGTLKPWELFYWWPTTKNM